MSADASVTEAGFWSSHNEGKQQRQYILVSGMGYILTFLILSSFFSSLTLINQNNTSQM